MTIPIVLKVLQDIRLHMQSGKSVSISLKLAVNEKNDPFSKSLRVWQVRFESGQNQESILETLPDLSSTPLRHTFLWVIAKGLQGAPIDDQLSKLEEEMFALAEQNYEKHLQLLPLKMVFPLMFLILPGVMVLLVAPLLFTLSQNF